jgi:exopolyphosphatase/guanosine-5'-triphosphate,3'-diphosphate pyrophosphatase
MDEISLAAGPAGERRVAAIDIGTNSIHLLIAAIDPGLHSFRVLLAEKSTTRLGERDPESGDLSDEAIERAFSTLRHCRDLALSHGVEQIVTAATSAVREAPNGRDFLLALQEQIDLDVDLISGQEEARLIYLGVAHGLPPSKSHRLVIDIGGGSTECIIGSGLKPLKLESMYMGCVSYSLRHFGDGKLNKANFRQAETAAGTELQTIRGAFRFGEWHHAIGSSGTARALGDLLEFNGYTDNGITREGLERLKAQMIRIGSLDRLDALSLAGLRADRVPVLPGGLAIMLTAFEALDIPHMALATGAMRQGILYDMVGRFHHHDMRDLTVTQFMHRYHVDKAQARRVSALAHALLHDLVADRDGESASAGQLLDWAANLHEIGISVAHSGYHKHTSYIIRNADMPGFSRSEQSRLATLALAHRGSLDKMQGMLDKPSDIALTLALRLATMFHRSRTDVPLPALEARLERNECRLKLEPNWLAANPLTAALLRDEIAQWRKVGILLDVRPMEELAAVA